MVINVKCENISKGQFFSPGQIEAAAAAAPDYVDDGDAPYACNDAAAFQAYWAHAALILPGRHRFQHATVSALEQMGTASARSIAVLNAQDDDAPLIAPLRDKPAGTKDEAADLVLMFAASQRDMDEFLPQAVSRLAPQGALWIAHRRHMPERESGLSATAVIGSAASFDLSNYAVVKLDNDWSCLGFRALS